MRNKLSFDLQLSARKAAIAERIAAHKIARSKVSVFLMAMSAGVFMAIGFTFYLSVIADAPSSQALTHLVGGLCFTLGFILLAVCGTNLFTSSVMTVMAKSRGVISWRTWLINALLVACGNLAGIACFSLLIWFSGLVMSENAMWGVAVLHCAEGKMHHTFTESVSLGIMCNLMVCLALWMSYCGRSLCDKIVAMILPITLFVASGFEHCIANLFVIPFAIAIRHFAPTSFWQLAHSSADNFPALTVSHFITANLLPVMLGNIIGRCSAGEYVLSGYLFTSGILKNQPGETVRRAEDYSCAICPSGQAWITALISVANGMAKNTPQNPHKPPKITTDKIITSGCRLTASENNTGTSRLPSSA